MATAYHNLSDYDLTPYPYASTDALRYRSV